MGVNHRKSCSNLPSLALQNLLLNGFFQWLGSALVIVSHVASLAHTHGVKEAIGVAALGGILVAAVPPVARRAHVLRVVLSVLVRALSNLLRLWLLELPKVNRVDFRCLLGNHWLILGLRS